MLKIKTKIIAKPVKALFTPRQNSIMQFISEGKSDKQMALILDISVKTVDMHIQTIFKKLKCHSRTEALSMAAKRGWVK